MEIRVSGHQVDTSDAFRTQVGARIQSLADKYFARSVGANVTLGRGPHDAGFVCDIVMQVTQGLILKGSGRSQDDAALAFDQAADKIDKQLRRYKRRLVDRDRQGTAGRALDGAEVEFNAAYTVFRADGAEVESEPADNPVIIAETRVDIPDASVSDAVMMLDLRNTNALLFKNTKTGAYNMVYRRDDGNIGWVEPTPAA